MSPTILIKLDNTWLQMRSEHSSYHNIHANHENIQIYSKTESNDRNKFSRIL